MLAAHAVKLALLQDAQQLGLRSRVQVADLVQEQRAVVRQLEFATPHGGRAGERALLVPEQLALDQLRRNRRAVHFHKRTGGERAEAVNVLCEQLFPGTRLADEQHACVRPRRHRGLLHGPQIRRAGADHFRPRAHHFAEAFVLAPQAGVLQRVFQRHQHFFAAQRFFEKIERAGARSLDCVGDRPVPGNHDRGRAGIVLLKRAQQVDAAAVGQAHVEQEGIGALRVAIFAELGHGAANRHRVAFALQNHAQRAADVVFVVNYQNFFGRHWSC